VNLLLPRRSQTSAPIPSLVDLLRGQPVVYHLSWRLKPARSPRLVTLRMAIAPWTCYSYRTVVAGERDGELSGIADDNGAPSLLDSHPSVVVTNGRVTMTRRSLAKPRCSHAASASFDGCHALATVLRQGDELSCWRGPTGDIGASVSRGGSFVLGLGSLSYTPGGDITIDHDPRVEETELARDFRYISRPGTQILWLDPSKPRQLEDRIRDVEQGCPGVNVLAIVVRSDDAQVVRDLNRRTMGRARPSVNATVFLKAAERFSSVEEWLAYGSALSTERPRDLWLRIRSGSHERLVPEGTSDTVNGWLVHVLRVYEPGLPGDLSQLGLVRANLAVTPAMLESSTAAVARGLTVG
jgi:hypothetical protein